MGLTNDDILRAEELLLIGISALPRKAVIFENNSKFVSEFLNSVNELAQNKSLFERKIAELRNVPNVPNEVTANNVSAVLKEMHNAMKRKGRPAGSKNKKGTKAELLKEYKEAQAKHKEVQANIVEQKVEATADTLVEVITGN